MRAEEEYMFSVQHIVWFAICIAGIVGALYVLKTRRPSLRQVLTVCCVIAAVSEVMKLLTYTQMVPSADGSTLHLFIEWRHLPLHLCSIQIFFIFFTRLAKDSRLRETILAFMYPTCIVGAFSAILLPSIFSTTIPVSEAFRHPIAYQFFIYHSMLIVLGCYIAMSGEVKLRFSHVYSTLAILGALGILSIYTNSAFAYVTYQGNELLSVENTPNFFFTYRTPIGIQLTELWQWYVYLGILAVLVVVLVTLFFLPFRKQQER